MEKYQDYRNNQPLTRNGKFTQGELIKGSFTLIGMAPIVTPGVPAPPSDPDRYEFKEGIVDAVNRDGEITRIRAEEIAKGSLSLNQMYEYHFQSTQ